MRLHLSAIAALAFAAITGAACRPGSSESSHGNGIEKSPASNECFTCHEADYDSVHHPPHLNVKPTTCGVCHSMESWGHATVRHKWPLTGAHEKTDCFGCHSSKPPMFEGTSEACYGCHRDKYDHNPLPWHAQFATTCEKCHSTDVWKPALPEVYEEEKKRLAAAAASTAVPVPPVATATATVKKPVVAPKPKPKPKPTTPPPPPVDTVTRPSGLR